MWGIMGAMAVKNPRETTAPIGPDGFRKWRAFSAIAIGMFLAVAEQTGVALALPEIADDFEVNIPAVQWITLGYVLSTSAAFMPLGRLSDIVGRPKVYTAGFVGFIVMAVVAGFSTAFWMLLVAKLAQGVASAGTQANAMAIVTEAFPRRERGRAIGLYTTVVGVGATAGPFLGGLLVSELGWRWLFYASVPLGLLAIGSAVWALRGWPSHAAPGEKRGRFDWVGAAASSGTLVSLLLALSNSHRFGWGSAPILVGLVGAGGLFTFFVWWELRSPHPMIDLRYFASRYFSLGVSTRFLTFLASAPRVILMPFYLIQVLGYEAHIAGLNQRRSIGIHGRVRGCERGVVGEAGPEMANAGGNCDCSVSNVHIFDPGRGLLADSCGRRPGAFGSRYGYVLFAEHQRYSEYKVGGDLRDNGGPAESD